MNVNNFKNIGSFVMSGIGKHLPWFVS